MDKFLYLILGTNDLVSFAASCFFALVGILLSLLLHATKRDVNEPTSPVQFSWSYLFCNNFKRILIAVISVFIALRFSDQLLGTRLTLFFSFIIGLSIDNLAKIIQNKILPA